MFERLFGIWRRWQACKMAAQVMNGCGMGTGDEGPAQRLWSLTVFFESYIDNGSGGTAREFGPRDPVELQTVKTNT